MKYIILLFSLPLALVAGCCCGCPCDPPTAKDPHVQGSTSGHSASSDDHAQGSSDSGMMSMPTSGSPDMGAGSSSST